MVGGKTVRFSGIRLLLVFVATNTIMILMLVPSMTSQHPWLAYFLPGQFQAGGNYSGYWVFFALVLLVDAITVIAVGLSVLLPALKEVLRDDLETLQHRLTDASGVPADLKARLIAQSQQELDASGYQMFIGRSILVAGAIFLVFAFTSVTLSFTRALPQDSMFVTECLDLKAGCAAGPREAINATVKVSDVQRFALDQIARATLLGAPDVYGLHVGVYNNNPANLLFSHFLFAFRLAFAVILVLVIVSLRLPHWRENGADKSSGDVS
jgi:hypothetical protein